jgi:hypothetical protein
MTSQINYPEAITTAAPAGTGGQLSMNAITKAQTSPLYTSRATQDSAAAS